MSETKWTPGPWSFSTEPQPNGCPIISARGLMIAMLGHSVRNPTQRHVAEGNARLMAAAPDLYAALEETLEIASRNEKGDYIKRANAALRKAEGE